METTSKYVMNTYGRLPVALVKGKGTKVWDAEGKEYLDFISGLAVNSLGHSHPRVVKAIWRQADTLMHVSNLYHIEPQGQLAKLLVENSSADKVFFCNSGAEANEAAIKLTRKYAKQNLGKDKYEIITAKQSFHGRTLATITATGQEKFQQGYDPLPEGFKYVPFNDLEALKKAIGPQTCAVMLEPVQGEGGVYPASKEYLKGVKDLCQQQNLLLIFDEVQCGLGRTGEFLASQLYQVEPDITTLAKALGNGFPIGAMMAKEDVAVFKPGDHATTFGGNPLASTAALATMQVMLDEGVINNAREMGRYFKDKLNSLAEKHSQIKEIRGAGLMIGVELETEGQSIVNYCREQGLLINCVGSSILRFLPPLTVKEKEIDTAIDILDKAMGG
ncbi:MAG: aspartate aminotransferase family protein [Firmicutes bacterium]|nr:aspartate aminotransferase family protein [Bacillota bacterium]